MEYEGTQIDTGNYKLKKLGLALASREAEIKALKTLLEETIREKDEKIEALVRKLKFWSGKRGEVKIRPKKKTTVETKAKAQGMQETAGEVPESPPFST
jgi:hypothetical protein